MFASASLHILFHPIIIYQQVGSKLHSTFSKKAKVQAMIIQHFWNRWKRECLTESMTILKIHWNECIMSLITQEMHTQCKTTPVPAAGRMACLCFF